MSNVIVLIPARFNSTRFVGKPLALINGQTMIKIVYNNVSSNDIEAVVVTDDQRIEDEVNSFGGRVVRVDDNVCCGTDRIYLAYKRFFQEKKRYDLILNIQGDCPLIVGDELCRLINFHLERKLQMATIVKKIDGFQEDFLSPHNVKTVYSPKTNYCYYFSRSPIPYYSENKLTKDIWYKHIGIYSFLPDALEKFVEAPKSFYENREDLEQLRAVELNFNIGAIETELDLIGVDKPEDIKKIEGIFNGQK